MGDILQFDRAERSGNNLAEVLSLNMITVTLIEIAQELKAALKYHENCKADGMKVLDKATLDSMPDKEEYEHRVRMLAYLCREQSKGLQEVAEMAERMTGATAGEEREVMQEMAEQIFQEYTDTHNTIIGQHSDNYIKVLEMMSEVPQD